MSCNRNAQRCQGAASASAAIAQTTWAQGRTNPGRCPRRRAFLRVDGGCSRCEAASSAHTMVREGQEFIQEHYEEFADFPAALSLGGMAWGLLRAIAECPNCPGVFRVPHDEDWHVLVCPQCHGVWADRDWLQKMTTQE